MMALVESTLFGIVDKEKKAIEVLKKFEPIEGYYVAFSGGKDSIVIQKLVEMARVKHDTHYNVTTIDPPELIYFMRKHYPKVQWDRNELPFLKMLIKRGFPLRQHRWCCREYKEVGGEGRIVITGVRWEESSKRANRRMIESCYRSKNKRFLNVIIGWTKDEVWEFIHKYSMPYCELYDQGHDRVGCLFCPMAYKKRRWADAERYPGFVKVFEKAFVALYNKKKIDGKISVDRWKDGKEMFHWWLYGEDMEKENPDQTVMFE